MFKLSIKILLILSLLCMIGLSVDSQGALAERDNVIIGKQKWPSAIAIQPIAIQHIIKVILEDELNIPVIFKSDIKADVIWSGMDTGSVDVCMVVWQPEREVAGIKKYVEERKTVELKLSYEISRGFYISRYVSEEYEMKTVQDLKKKPEIFSGDIWIGHPGWFTSTVNAAKVKNYELPLKPIMGIRSSSVSSKILTEQSLVKLREENIPPDVLAQLENLKNQGYPTEERFLSTLETTLGKDHTAQYKSLILKHAEQYGFIIRLIKTMNKHQPIVFYYWEPAWIHSQYDLVLLEEPPYSEDQWKEVRKTSKNIVSAWPPAKVYVAFSKKLKDRLPKVYKFLQNWSIPVDEMNFLIAELEAIPDNPKKDPEQVARAWIKNNPQIVEDWLKGIE